MRSWKEKIKAFFLFQPFFSKRLERENNYLQLIDDKPTKLIELLKINHTQPKKELSWWILLRDEMDESDRSVAVPKLIELLNTSNGELRREAFDALRLIGKSALPALPLLLRFLHHPDPEVRSSSACTLGGLSNPVFDKEWGSIGEAAIVAIPHLLHLLDDPIADVRAKALGALKLIASVPCLLEPVFDAAPKIIALLDDPNVIVRCSAVSAVGSSRSHAQSVLPKLIQFLHYPEWSVRLSSVRTIETLGNLAADAVPHLIPLLEDNEYSLIRFDAARVLIKMGESGNVAIPFVKAALEASLQGNNFSHTQAAILLSEMGEEEIELAIPHLISFLSSAVGFRTAAVNALGNLGERARIAIPDLMLLLDDEDKYLRDAANSALSKVWYQS